MTICIRSYIRGVARQIYTQFEYQLCINHILACPSFSILLSTDTMQLTVDELLNNIIMITISGQRIFTTYRITGGASLNQISCLSVKPLFSCCDLSIFSKRRPSAMLNYVVILVLGPPAKSIWWSSLQCKICLESVQ